MRCPESRQDARQPNHVCRRFDKHATPRDTEFQPFAADVVYGAARCAARDGAVRRQRLMTFTSAMFASYEQNKDSRCRANHVRRRTRAKRCQDKDKMLTSRAVASRRHMRTRRSALWRGKPGLAEEMVKRGQRARRGGDGRVLSPQKHISPTYVRKPNRRRDALPPARHPRTVEEEGAAQRVKELYAAASSRAAAQRVAARQAGRAADVLATHAIPADLAFADACRRLPPGIICSPSDSALFLRRFVDSQPSDAACRAGCATCSSRPMPPPTECADMLSSA